MGFSLLVVILCILISEGGKKYQIKGCSGQGGFAQVFKAYVDNNPEIVVALKVSVISYYRRILIVNQDFLW